MELGIPKFQRVRKENEEAGEISIAIHQFQKSPINGTTEIIYPRL